MGAINSAWLASHAHRPDMDISGRVGRVGKCGCASTCAWTPWASWPGAAYALWLSKLRGDEVGRVGRSLLDPRALEELVARAIPYKQLHHNVDTGVVRALVVASLGVEDGITTMSSRRLLERTSPPSKRPAAARSPHAHRLRAPRAGASRLIPLIFPARSTAATCDGRPAL
ncbi:MAG: hypothetical protein IPI43_32545 [Sandaracinaceae bacterium]|nr:hypothetical protein [Sandaracinaceae bacterium]